METSAASALDTRPAMATIPRAFRGSAPVGPPATPASVGPPTTPASAGPPASPASVGPSVAMVRWPEEEALRARLASDGAPRLLLVPSNAAPPPVEDPLEDWIRIPAPDADLRARVDTLARRAGHQVDDLPALDDDGVIRCRRAWASLPPVEARLTRALLDRFGAVVSRDSLSRAGWPEGAPGRNALDVHVLRLRRRLEPLALVIRTVRSRGYLLEAGAPLAREA